MTYQAPVNDIMFALKIAANLGPSIESGVYPALDIDTIEAVISEAGKFGGDVLAPLRWIGDRIGSKLVDGVVTTAPGFRDAYRQFAEAGWNALPGPEAFGGQGLPEIVASAVCEIWNSSNMGFALCPLLTQGAIHAIEVGGSDTLKSIYLPNLVSGRWTGTMNLTEPHAGSDLSVLRTKAVRDAGGNYRITGTKIFISYGEHDLAENIIHLVLARLSDAPTGTHGISLFLVPKYLVNDDGSLGARNDVVCAGIEHKLGIHASPTCVMKFGENDGAIGYLIGEENHGLTTMFVMMNAARLAVGMQGVAVAESATQQAIRFAKDRTQGHGASAATAPMSPIIEHADVRRMLLSMKSQTQAARMICFATARAHDAANTATDKAARKAALHRTALLTPIAKAYATDVGVDVASLGIQVHGGVGYVEETGAAQHLRDARILPIYEGTNGIQAIDLVTRKLPLEDGNVVSGYLLELAKIAAEVRASNRPDLGRTGDRLAEAIRALQEATEWMADAVRNNQPSALAGATPYLRLFSVTAGAAYLAKGALQSESGASAVSMARFFAENILTQSHGLAEAITTGADSVLVEYDAEVFA
ncbi:MAG: acyl-CoA dehydrogenase [Hyphomicrobium sp.]|nr:acyl-CoA dehydrogenase [Hyphomicrobium sp.]